MRMSGLVSPSQVEAARLYEALFVPALFGPWASKVVDTARIRPGERVLDVACGTGVLARVALARTGPHGLVCGLDPSHGMLTIARGLAPAIAWQHGSAEAMPFADQDFDVVLSQFGLMFFADRRQALREMLRVLLPGGRMVVAVWDALAEHPGYAAFVAVVERHAGMQFAEALRAPFALGNREDLFALFRYVGAVSVALSTQRCTARYPSVRAMAETYLRVLVSATGPILTGAQIERIVQDTEDDLHAYIAADGRFVYETQAHIVTASRN